MASSLRLHALLLAAAAAFALAGRSASAGEPNAADKETARALMKDGDRAYDAKRYAEALKAYRAAHAIMNIPNTGIWVAKAEEALGQLVEARDTALAVTRLPKSAVEGTVGDEARREAEGLAAGLRQRIPSIRVELKGVPSDQRVQMAIDGITVPAAAVAEPRKVNPGKHALKASAVGFAEATAEVTVSEGENKVVPLVLVPSTAPTSRSSSPNDSDATRGTHLSPLVFVGFGLAAVGVGVGTVTGILALSKASDAKSQCEGTRCSPSAEDSIDASDRFAIAADVGFGVAVAGAVLGVAGLVVSRGSQQKSAQRVWLTPRSLSIRSSW